jgi:hypothetical protein
MSQGRDLSGLLSRHELHQNSPYGQQTKGHSNNSGIGAHRAVSCLDRARMTKAALSRREMRELLEAMRAIAATGEAPPGQVPSIGCSIKWKAAA